MNPENLDPQTSLAAEAATAGDILQDELHDDPTPLAPPPPTPPAPPTPPEEKEPEPAEEIPEETSETDPFEDNTEAELEAFDSLIGSYLDDIVQHEVSSIISVRVVDVGAERVLIDLGDKAEGVVDTEEFIGPNGEVRVQIGDRIDVEVLGRNDETGLIEVSYRRARARVAWDVLSKAYDEATPIKGIVLRTVKSGLLVDVGLQCFMPASQISDRRVNDLEEWVGKEVEALVVDLSEDKKRAVVSRRRLVEGEKKKSLEIALSKLQEGDVYEGSVRSVLSFGAFLEIDGVDAYLPREELSWDRGVTPASLLEVDDKLKVKLLQIDSSTGRIKVSRKALYPDPWAKVPEKYPEKSLVEGEIVSLTRFGAFVRLEEGLTGLIHVSDLSWNKDSQRVSDHVKEGDRVSAVVLSVDTEKRRLSLGLKQMVEDPWIEAEKQCPKGSKVTGTVTSLASFGAFVQVTDEIEGLIHISEFSWDEQVKHPSEKLEVGQKVEAVVLKTDRSTRRISLGLRQLTQSPIEKFMRENRPGTIIEGEVVRMIPVGAFISLVPASGGGGKLDGFLHVSQIDSERVEKPEDKLKIGEKIKCKILKIEKGSGKISLSRKAILEHEERESIKQYRVDPKKAGTGVMKLGELLQGIILPSSDSE